VSWFSHEIRLLPIFLLMLAMMGLSLSGLRPVYAAPVHVVSLDANSSSATDATVETSANDAHTFRIGAIVNATPANPLLNVFGFQFSINYNATAFVAQGDPSSTSVYPDGAGNTVDFGAQTTAGTVNWAGLLGADKAFQVVTVQPPSGSEGAIIIALTILSPNPAVNMTANTLLANAAFELINKPSTTQSFTISNVIFVDKNGFPISSIVAGAGVTESITNDPPTAMFSAKPDPSLGPMAFTFNATASFDGDGSIANPTGYYWDFGDGTQDLGVSGSVVAHNFTYPGVYDVTLRVVDSLGATGSARDSVGSVIFNSQPSHVSLTVTAGKAVNIPPVAIFDSVPATPQTGETVQFDGSASYDPDGTVVAWSWDFGDGSAITSASPFASHSYSAPGNYTVTLNVTDDGGATGQTSQEVHVIPVSPVPVTVAVNTVPGSPLIQNMTTVTGNFTIDVDVVGVSSLYGWQTSLSYDTSILSPSKISLGPFWQNALADNQGFLAENATNTATGTISLAFTLLGMSAPTFNGTGVLAAVSFTPLKGGTSPLHLSNTILVAPPAEGVAKVIPSTTQDGLVTVFQPDEPPVASFTFTPTNPVVGTSVFFNGSNSSDPDGVIVNWMWDFGDGFVTSGPSEVYHSYAAAGNYTVTLKVTDSSGLSNNTFRVVSVQPIPEHDVAVSFVSVSPQIAISTSMVNVEVGILNTGSSNDTVSIIVFANSTEVATLNGIFVEGPPPGCTGCEITTFVSLQWDTTGAVEGNYTISVTVLLPGDPTPADNSMTDGTVTVLPPPSITLTRSSGPDGTEVLVRGSGFPAVGQGALSDEVDVMFDDNFLGFELIHNGSFVFTLDVPLSQAGPHLVKAFDVYYATRASAVFTVTPTTGNLVVDVTVGTVYFPGDTATVYVLATLNGVPVAAPSATVTGLLINPNGANVTLTLYPQTSGLYKATFGFSKTATIGTYAILARVHTATGLDATSVAVFEVKLPWLSTGGGRETVAAGAVVGMAGLMAVVWKKGYLRRRDEPSTLAF
jgi:PKD repeat protein